MSVWTVGILVSSWCLFVSISLFQYKHHSWLIYYALDILFEFSISINWIFLIHLWIIWNYVDNKFCVASWREPPKQCLKWLIRGKQTGKLEIGVFPKICNDYFVSSGVTKRKMTENFSTEFYIYIYNQFVHYLFHFSHLLT